MPPRRAPEEERTLVTECGKSASEGLTEEQAQVQSIAREFARNELAPNMGTWDASEEFPVETLRKSAQLGFSGKKDAPANHRMTTN